MRNNYETAEAAVMGRAQDVILGSKENIQRDSDLDPFLNVMDDDD